MTGIRLTGLASNLDTESIITQLMNVENQSRGRLTRQQAAVQARSDALKDIQSKLNSLKSAATGLRSAGTWADVQTADSSDPTKVAARTTAGAAPGGHSIEVTQLARGAQSTYDFAVQAGASTLTVNGQSVALAAGATLDDAVSAINASSTANVYAVKVGGKLAISAKTTGAASAADASGTALSAGVTIAGLDSAFKVDGTAYTRATNVVADVVAGVELTLKGTTATGTTATVTIGNPGPDRELLVSKIKTFVEAYNATIDAVRMRTTEKRVANAATSTDAKRGVLFGDAGLNGILSSMRSTVSTAVAGNPATLDQLSEIGISTGASTGTGTPSPDSVQGKLTFTDATLRAALDTDPTSVRRLLGGIAGTNGFAQALEGVLEPFTQTAGVLDLRVDSAKTDLKNVADSLTRFDARMSTKEAQLRKRFTALEGALQTNQSTLASVSRSLGLS